MRIKQMVPAGDGWFVFWSGNFQRVPYWVLVETEYGEFVVAGDPNNGGGVVADEDAPAIHIDEMTDAQKALIEPALPIDGNWESLR